MISAVSMVEWRAVPDWPSYEVSADGQVRSLDRRVPHYCGGTRLMRGRLLKPVIRNGYPFVTLYRPGRYKIIGVHQVVLRAFVGPPPEGLEALHGDGDRSNANLNNLRWGTHTENVHDAIRHGTQVGLDRERCPRRHLLEAPNLVASQIKLGWRLCRACHQTFAARALRPGLDFQAESDRRYEAIMGGAQPTDEKVCAQGHRVEAPNLTARGNCLACRRARSMRDKTERSGRPFDFRAAADARYRKIMEGPPPSDATCHIPAQQLVPDPSPVPTQRGADSSRDSAAAGGWDR